MIFRVFPVFRVLTELELFGPGVRPEKPIKTAKTPTRQNPAKTTSNKHWKTRKNHEIDDFLMFLGVRLSFTESRRFGE